MCVSLSLSLLLSPLSYSFLRLFLTCLHCRQRPRHVSGLNEYGQESPYRETLPLTCCLCFLPPSTNDLVFRMTSVERGVFEISGKYLGAKLKVSENKRGKKGQRECKDAPFVSSPFVRSLLPLPSLLVSASVDAKHSIQTAVHLHRSSFRLCPHRRKPKKIASYSSLVALPRGRSIGNQV